MLTKDRILELLNQINQELKIRELRGEIILLGGAVMTVVFNARGSTDDIDALYHPKDAFSEIISKIGIEEGLPKKWLNDAVALYIPGEVEKEIYLELSNLIIYNGSPHYMLALKLAACREEEGSPDEEDIEFLVKHLQLQSAKDALDIAYEYVPVRAISPRANWVLESIFEELNLAE